MNSRSDKNALAKLARKGKNCMADMCSGSSVEEAVFTFSWSDVDFLLADHIMELVGVNARRIYDTACLENAFCCLDLPDILSAGDVFYFCVEMEVGSIRAGIFSESDRHVERADDPAGWRV